MRKELWFIIGIIGFIFLTGCGRQERQTSQKSPTRPIPQPRENASAVAAQYVELGKSALERGDVQAAIRNFDEAIRRDPRDVNSYIVLGETYLRLQNYDKTIDTLSAGLLIDPNHGPGNYMLAVAYNLWGNREKALQHAQKSVQIFQDRGDREGFRLAFLLLQSLAKTNGQRM